MERPIFIIGSGRSGTTLLRNMLNAHPRIHIAFEPHFYWYRSLFRKRRPARELLDFYFQSPHFRWLRVDPGRVLAQLPSPIGREHLGLAFATILRERAARYGCERFGDKTPANVSTLETIFADFPEARAIHIVRDPRATVASLMRMPWAPASLLINSSYLEIERQRAAKFSDRMLAIRLEDLLADPRATMTRVLEFVGEPWHDHVLDHASHQPDRDDVPPYPWLERAKFERDAAGTRDAQGAGWGDLTPTQIRMVEQIAKHVMRVGGYKPAELATEPRWISVFWAGVREIPRYFPLAARGLWLWFNARDPKKLDWAERQVLLRTNPDAWARYPGYELPCAPPLASLGSGDSKRELPAAMTG